MFSKMRKRGFCLFLVFCQIFTITAFAKPDWPADTGIQAEAGSVMDLDSGTLLLGQNSHVEYPPASITKILTALIVIENSSLDDMVTFSETAMNSVESDSGNKLSLVAGDTLSVEDCLYALLLASVNQSANALAEHVAGSIPAFVDMMNEKLVELGCTESHFDNPSGLNGDTQYVTAYDMAKIARAAYSNETLLKISSTISHKVGATTNNPDGVTIRHEHRLVITEDASSPYYCPEAVAGKTGYLLAAGNTLVTYAEKDGRRLVSVILKGSPRQYFVDGKNLLEFGFDRFKNVDIAENETNYVTGDQPVEIGGKTYAPEELMVEPGRVITLPKTAEFADAELNLAELPASGYPEGAVAVLNYIYNERKIGSAYLVEKANYKGSTVGAPDDGTEPGAEETTEGAEAESTGEPAAEPSGDGSQIGDQDGSGNGGDVPVSGPGFSLKGPGLLILVILLILVLLFAGGFAWILHSRKKEEEAAALRREQRRKRLSESEGMEAEFDRLMEEKRNRNKGQRRHF